ncbi:MAG TPA: xanthine dehydrogenase family protein molybdopterin-binding subunit, partial [Ktedonobacterales bacterium]
HTAHLALIRSPQPHARIERVETARAEALPGVLAVFSARDLPEIMRPAPGMAFAPGARLALPTPLAVDVVRYVGEPVAVVVAEDRYVAEDGAEAVEVVYSPLPAVAGAERARAPDAPLVHADWPGNVAEHFTVTVGDGARALERAAVVVEATLRVGRVSAQPMEPRAVLAQYDESTGLLTIFLGSQAVHRARAGLSAVLGLPAERIRVLAPEVGGAFGVKTRQYGEEVLAAHLAMRLRRPIKWVGDRREEFISTNQGRAQLHHVRLGLDGAGRILALADHFLQDAGAYNITAAAPAHNFTRILPGPYRVPHLEIACDVVFTHTVATGPYRGAGRPEAAYVMERLLDHAAEATGLDRMEIRHRNLIQSSELPYSTGIAEGRGTITYNEGDFPAGFQQVLTALDYSGFRQRQAEARARGVYLGIGIANSLEMAGIGAGERATMRVADDGTVTVTVGVVGTGQGHRTAYAQIAADRLGVPIERVTVVQGDTAAIAEGIGTFASRSTVAAGNAVSATARALRQRLLRAAADQLEVTPADLEWHGERVAVRGVPRTSLPYWEVVRAAGGELVEEAGAPGPRTFGFQAHGVILAVDPDMLAVRLHDYVICHDAGTIVNPLLADGQTIGSAVQGLGCALLEEICFDAEGHPLTTALHQYPLPTSAETPDYRIIEQHFPARDNAEGFKGLGEGGAIPSVPAIAQAIEDALSPFGARFDDVPITPQRLREMLATRESNP